jgi:hypothetical protein
MESIFDYERKVGMNLNLEFLVVAYFISLFVDWIFQWDWQAVNKSKWNFNDNWRHSFFALGTHSLVYAILTSGLLSSLCIITVSQGFLVVLVLLATHLIIDTRIPGQLPPPIGAWACKSLD